MVVLNESEKHKITALFRRPYPSRMWLNAYLQDRVPGITYVDQPNSPKIAIVVTEFHHVTFVGLENEKVDFSQAWNEVLRQEIYLWLVWDSTLYPIVPKDNRRGGFGRLEFETLDLDVFNQAKLAALKTEGELSLIDHKSFELIESKSENLFAYETKERYLKETTGFVLTKNGEYIGNAEALSRGVSSAGTSEVDIQIVTAKNSRRRGYGTKLATVLIAELLKSEISPTWSCNSNNPPSEGLAKKLGFTNPRHFEIITYEIEAPFPKYWARVLKEFGTTYERKTETIAFLQTEFLFTRQEAHRLTINYIRDKEKT